MTKLVMYKFGTLIDKYYTETQFGKVFSFFKVTVQDTDWFTGVFRKVMIYLVGWFQFVSEGWLVLWWAYFSSCFYFPAASPILYLMQPIKT